MFCHPHFLRSFPHSFFSGVPQEVHSVDKQVAGRGRPMLTTAKSSTLGAFPLNFHEFHNMMDHPLSKDQHKNNA